jgi:AcrR family transcriptional regulator
MPTQTYEHLPPEKKQRILAAVCRELARVPFDQISINRIVQDAQIARGSFYQYFSGKDDLFLLVTEDFARYFDERTRFRLTQHQGDPFLLILGIFDDVCSYGKTSSDRQLFQNLFEQMRQRTDQKQKNFVTTLSKQYWQYKYPKEQKVEGYPERDLAFEILCDLLCSALVRVWIQGAAVDEVRVQLEQKLWLVRHGIEREGEQTDAGKI